MKSQLVEVCVYLKDIRLIGVTLLITAQCLHFILRRTVVPLSFKLCTVIDSQQNNTYSKFTFPNRWRYASSEIKSTQEHDPEIEILK
ncbi:unnamed protein product [Albugo candida]|uniref:Uncharacterized protein n=1 Tax=Albugo candida TaxID=65357 RepID=A0A024GUJ0_9STRA|nr:unnamed protein product [Albugo candida]|eukprot:CCI50637.1 unnamed protein product [Albugo candida]